MLCVQYRLGFGTRRDGKTGGPVLNVSKKAGLKGRRSNSTANVVFYDPCGFSCDFAKVQLWTGCHKFDGAKITKAIEASKIGFLPWDYAVCSACFYFDSATPAGVHWGLKPETDSDSVSFFRFWISGIAAGLDNLAEE